MSKKTLNHANLTALGADQLAQLLLEVSTGSADIKRRLRLELSHHLGPAELAQDLRKRLSSLRKSKSFVGWRRRKALLKDLSTQHQMIHDKIAPLDAGIAFEIMWEFIDIAPSVFARTDDSKGEIAAVFGTALSDLGAISVLAAPEPQQLADRLWPALLADTYGVWDTAIPLLAPALGQTGLTQLRQHIEAFAQTPIEDNDQDHEAIQFLRQLRGGASYAQNRKARFVKSCLQQIATATGDVQAYIAQFSTQELRRRDVSADVAVQLLRDGHPESALDSLLQADQDHAGADQDAWDNAYIACLLALGRVEDAQTHRWSCFVETLNPEHLRSYLKTLPDFEDVDAEDDARRHVLSFPDAMRALQFCLSWPDLVTAGDLITSRYDDIDPRHTTLLGDAAAALRARQPLIAVMLLRAVIDDVLHHGAKPHYVIAADHLADCASLDGQITDYRNLPPHADYLKHLRSVHAHKASFWSKVPQQLKIGD